MASFIKKFDLYAKVPRDLTNPTTTGSIISILAVLFMLYLFISESISFIQPRHSIDLIIEPDEGQKLHVNINMTFPHFPCFALSLDVVDAMGRHEVGLSSTLVKTRINSQGTPVGQFTNMPSDAELRQQASEGCNIVGFVAVNKVPGNFHISAHTSVNLVQHYLHGRMNLQHVIHSLWIGDKYLTPKEFPGHLHPLDGTTHLTEDPAMVYEYFLDIIPTVYRRYGTRYKGYQLVPHRHMAQAGGHMPAVFFRYTLSPLQVIYTIERKSFSHFLVREASLCHYRRIYVGSLAVCSLWLVWSTRCSKVQLMS